MGDPYLILGVSPHATDEEIRRTWRKLISQNHPDLHRGQESAELRTSRINEAYQTIKTLRAKGIDPKLEWPPPPPPPPSSRWTSPPPPPPPRRGEDVRREIELSWERAFRGGSVNVKFNDGQSVAIKIPPGCEIGKSWRRKGKGRPGRPPGDLIIRLARYSEDVPWVIKGLNVHMNMRVTFYKIYTRQGVTVTSPWGKEYRFFPDFENREPTKIKGAGVKKGKKKGDMIIEWSIVYPQRHDPVLSAVLREMQG